MRTLAASMIALIALAGCSTADTTPAPVTVTATTAPAPEPYPGIADSSPEHKFIQLYEHNRKLEADFFDQSVGPLPVAPLRLVNDGRDACRLHERGSTNDQVLNALESRGWDRMGAASIVGPARNHLCPGTWPVSQG